AHHRCSIRTPLRPDDLSSRLVGRRSRGSQPLQSLHFNDRFKLRPRDLVPPYQKIRRMAEPGEYELDWGGGPTGSDAVHIGKAKKHGCSGPVSADGR
ncbi:MAG: hypothetical protein ACKO9H_08630, partial [Planctomycetota bacterium]